MRRILFCVLLGIITSAPLAYAQDPNTGLAMLAALNGHHQLPQLIQAANALLKNQQLTTVEKSIVLTYLGHAYQQEGDFHNATAHYEKALALLDRDNLHPAEYATTLAALATLYAETGQMATAKHVLLRSIHSLEKEGGHHAELAMFWNNLATLAAEEHSSREAHKCMKQALAELQLSKDAAPDETEAITRTQARIAEIDGDYRAAIAGYQRSLALWKQSHEERHPETAMLYILLGEAYLQAGDIPSARDMTSSGWSLMQATSDPQSIRYLAAELAYSKVLDATGSHDEATKYRKEAKAGMAAQSKRAQGEISVSALR